MVKSILGLGRCDRSSEEELRPRERPPDLSVLVFRAIAFYLISRCRVCRRRKGLNFFSSTFSVLSFLFRVVM